MPETKPRYANFPDPSLKVVIGPSISATMIKTLTRMTIGTYEMSFIQQEKGAITTEAARVALHAVAKAQGMTLASEKNREFVGIHCATGPDLCIKLWVTTPFELTQAGHVIWVKCSEIGGEGKVGIAFKLATGYTADEIGLLIKTAQRNMVKVPEGEPYTLKGNPPPRFQKKAAPAAADGSPAADASASEPEAAAAHREAAPETPAG